MIAHSKFFAIALLLFLWASCAAAQVQLGIDVLLSQDPQLRQLDGKKIALVTNQTAVNASLKSTLEILKSKAENYEISAIFAPEHGFYGRDYANQHVDQEKGPEGITIYSLYGNTRRPTEAMLGGINLIIYDIQDIGARSYTFITTLFYVMEAAAKKMIPVIVLDRPNPINGITIDGPMLEEPFRSMVGYVNVPYCYGMTVGEIAQFFNKEYKVGCLLEVIPMKGWSRSMSFKDTGLPWIPTSPHIPESDTPLYYPITGVIGELSIVNIGVGYTLPFKLIGAPWIDAHTLAKELNGARSPGVYFTPYFFRPFYGKFKGSNCEGVLITVSDPSKYKPAAIQYLILYTLKKLYPTEMADALKESLGKKEMFCKVTGTEKIWNLIQEKKAGTVNYRAVHEKERHAFYETRKSYLIESYSPRSSGT